MCVATALSRQVAERQHLQWDWRCSAFSHVSSLKPAIEVGGGCFIMSFPPRVNEEIVLEEPQKMVYKWVK